MVVVAVLIASLIEVFFILPAHLAHFASKTEEKTSGFRYHFDTQFNRFRNGPFRRLVEIAVNWRYATIALSLAMFIFSVGMMAGGRVNFVFFSSPEADIAFGNIVMAPAMANHGGNVHTSSAPVLSLFYGLVIAQKAQGKGRDQMLRFFFWIARS
jgi:multidrug efflux pump subunit AcrB